MRRVLAADYGHTFGSVGDKPCGVVPEDKLSEEDERLQSTDPRCHVRRYETKTFQEVAIGKNG